MPTQRMRLTRTKYQEDRARLLRLEKMGIPIGSAGDSSQAPERLTLQQIDHQPAMIYELPLGDVAVVVPAKMTVTSRILITDLEMTTPWDDLLLDLSDPEEIPCYEDLIAKLPEPPPEILNHRLTGGDPLRLCQKEGVIIAHGWSSVPSKCRDGTLVTVKLFLGDERDNELCFGFEARVDRSLKRKYAPRPGECLSKRVPIFAHKDGQLGDQETPSSNQRPTMTQAHAALQRLQKLEPEEQ